MIRRILFLVALTLAAGHGQGADGADKPPPPRSLRLLPLGESPPFRQIVTDGVRYEQEPEPGSIPPRQIRFGEGDKPTLLRLNLGRATEPIKIPAGTAAVLLREATAPNDPALKPWLTLHPPETGDVLAVLWRDPGTRWTLPRSLLFADTAAALPAGSIRIVNLLPVDAALIFAEERVILPPGKALIKPLATGTDLPVQIAFKNATGQFQRFYSGAVLLNPNERAQIFIHRADGEKPRLPAKVVTFNETAPPPPKPQP
ncbi:MAG: hypothetical protein WCK77_09420 [Verrucomicrobiota bacterium]